MTDERFDGVHGHLYDGMAKCKNPRCRFYAKDPEVVRAHEPGCSGKVVMTGPFCGFFCGACRFDAQNADELEGHYKRGDCVNELTEINMPLYQLNYDVLDHTNLSNGSQGNLRMEAGPMPAGQGPDPDAPGATRANDGVLESAEPVVTAGETASGS